MLCETLMQFALEAAVQSILTGGTYRIIEVRHATVRAHPPLPGRVEAVGELVSPAGDGSSRHAVGSSTPGVDYEHGAALSLPPIRCW